uniref:MHD domain-containing protein n=1 Tax=Trichuris muris TaxID=70415 RepID=A0A5S6QE64_TRIMR
MDFSEHFWGDKHNGFAVMYQIMKGGQQTVKDLFELLKDRAGAEDDNHRHGTKTVKLISNFDSHGSMNPLWCTLKSYFQKLLDVQQGFVIRLLDLSKEVQRFGDDQFKIHKSVKEKESKTFEAVNLIQTTSTCLQKAKELYHARCLDLEKMKRENCSLKELNRMQIRQRKAREEYRHYVDKYESVRVDFEERLTAAAKNFQSLQFNHLEQMKKFLTTYMLGVSHYYQSLLSLSQQANAEIVNVDVTTLLAELVTAKGTGEERPARVKFEESECASAHDSLPSLSSETLVREIAASSSCATRRDGAASDIDQSNQGHRGINMFLPSSSRDRSSGTSSLSSTNSSPLASAVPSISTSQSKTKLNLWLPGRRSSAKSSPSVRKGDGSSPAAVKLKAPDSYDPSDSGKQPHGDTKAAWTNPLFESSFSPPNQKDLDAAGIASSDSCQDVNRKRTISIGFLKRISKDKKKGPDLNHSFELKDDEPNPVCTVATTVNSAEQFSFQSSFQEQHSNSSDSDSENEDLDKKINIKIKPLKCDAVSGSASADELREAVGNMAFAPAFAQGSVFSKSIWSTEAGSVSKVNRLKPGMLLRPARTGDDKWNNLVFAGSEQRLRPRSTTPTHMISLDRQYPKSENEMETPHVATLRENDSNCSSPLFSASQGPSLSPRDLREKIPLAVAIIETVHALFKVDGDCIVKVFGSVTVSFPSGCLRLLKHDANAYPLVFSMKNVTKIHSVVYNQKLMRRAAVKPDLCHKYEFNMKTLLSELQEQARRTPVAPYYNLEVIRYEVQTEPSGGGPDRKQMAPLLLHSSWSQHDDSVQLCIRYGYNPQCCLCSPLLNVMFITDVCGSVQGVQCNSDMSWSHEENRLQFNLNEVSCHKSSSGTIRTTVKCANGNVVSAPVMAQFQANDSCLSNAQLELLCKYYRLSLMRRRLLSGKYICEPQIEK